MKIGAAMLLAVLMVGCASDAPRMTTSQIETILSSPDRTETDRVNDKRRKPADMLAFLDVRPGMRVLDIAAGGGYTSELMARSVGPTGQVYAHNTEYWLKNFVKGGLDNRMKTAAMRNVTPNVAEFDDPVPPGIAPGSLDLVTFMFNYHDLGWVGTDRARMNKAIFAALKKGGHYVIADHSGRPGTGITESKTLHRIEESLVRKEVEAVGFKLVAEGNFLRNPDDPRDKSVFKPAQPNDEFVLKFVKP